VCNFAASETRVPLHDPERGLSVALASKERVKISPDAVEMPPLSVAILE
jgi:hypothetical protein